MLERRKKIYQVQFSEGSISTEQSESHSPHAQHRKKYKKEKSELCWKFMENGECPYQLKCKFAHGLHELTKDRYVNLKYKTKECIAYFNNTCCHFGIRCNFLHIRKEEQEDRNWQQATSNYRQLLYEAKQCSKLLLMEGI